MLLWKLEGLKTSARSQAAPWSIPWIAHPAPTSSSHHPVLCLFYFGGFLRLKPAFSSSPLNLLKVLLSVMLREGCFYSLWEEQGVLSPGYHYKSFSFTAKINGIRTHFLAGCGIKQLKGLSLGFTILWHIRFWFVPEAKYPI